MGSKSGIVESFIGLFPRADNFYDLFGGGFSVTHAGLIHRAKDFKKFHFNEIRPGICELIKDSIAGKYSYENFSPPWVSREEFFAKKDQDAYIKICWSFGNNGKGYLFGKDIEDYKRSMHMAVVFNAFNSTARELFGCDKFPASSTIKDRRFHLKNRQKVLAGDRGALRQLEQLDRLQQLERLEQLQQLQQLERLQALQQLQQPERLEQLQRLEFYNKSYDEIQILDNSVVYCDPPYKGTASYDGDFDHDKFFNWAANASFPVFISEYAVPDDRFKIVHKIQKRSLFSAKKDVLNIKTELIFANQSGFQAMLGKSARQVGCEC